MPTLFEEFLMDQEVIEDLREDVNIPMRSLTFTEDGKLKSQTYGELIPSEASIKALCKLYGFSYQHIKVLEKEGLNELISEQFNHFLSKDRKVNKLRLIEDRVQGIVDKNYKKYDNFDVFSQTYDFLNEQGYDFRTDIMDNNEEYTRIRFMINDLSKNVGMAEENGLDRDVIQCGFEIANSEIGGRNMGLNSLIYRQVCTNGMMRLVKDDSLEIFHKRGKDFNIASRRPMLNNALIKSLTKSKDNVELFGRTKNILVDEPEREFNKIGDRYNLGRKHVEGFEKSFKIEPQKNMFGIINGITRYSKDEFGKKDYSNRAKFEYIANDVLTKLDKRR